MTDKEKLIELIQSAVGGCARHWAELIADKLIDNGVTLPPEKPEPVPSRCQLWDPGHGYPTCFYMLREKIPCNCDGRVEKCPYR